MVESQHVAATMKLVDSRDEQDVLENLLESSMPSQPSEMAGLDYLLTTPFRYLAKRGGSRFRGATDKGVFYGAESVRTAAAELAYWRWTFLNDAVDLDRLEPVAHHAFSVEVSTMVVDLKRPPFDVDTPHWQHKTDYRATQHFARVAREAGMGGILYQSVRDPTPSWCLALLSPSGFVKKKPNPDMQIWYMAVSPSEFALRSDSVSMRFSAEHWM